MNPFMHNVDKWSNILCLHHKISKVCLVIFQHNACKGKSVFKIISITSFVFLPIVQINKKSIPCPQDLPILPFIRLNHLPKNKTILKTPFWTLPFPTLIRLLSNPLHFPYLSQVHNTEIGINDCSSTVNLLFS